MDFLKSWNEFDALWASNDTAARQAQNDAASNLVRNGTYYVVFLSGGTFSFGTFATSDLPDSAILAIHVSPFVSDLGFLRCLVGANATNIGDDLTAAASVVLDLSASLSLPHYVHPLLNGYEFPIEVEEVPLLPVGSILSYDKKGSSNKGNGNKGSNNSQQGGNVNQGNKSTKGQGGSHGSSHGGSQKAPQKSKKKTLTMGGIVDFLYKFLYGIS